MPQNARALTRAARQRARAKGETYTQARAAVIEIDELARINGWTLDEAAAWYDDPRNQLMCGSCGWTWGMVCPECVPGCGCETRCSGWRHREYHREGDDLDDDPTGCPECGAGGGGDPYGQCVCFPE